MLSREAGYFVANLHRAAGTVLGRYRNLPIGIVASVFVAPPAYALVLVVREFLFYGQIRIFFGNLQLHIVAKADLAVRGRGEVRFGFEGQFSVKGIELPVATSMITSVSIFLSSFNPPGS